VGGVVLGQVGVGGEIARGVDRHHLELVAAAQLIYRAQRAAADPPVSVDRNLDGHEYVS
jgi:hypothetical protein